MCFSTEKTDDTCAMLSSATVVPLISEGPINNTGPAVTKISFSSASTSTEGFPQFAVTKHAEDHLS
jgi:hypothetical protein